MAKGVFFCDILPSIILNKNDMTDEEKAYYEDWKRKCAATKARKLNEFDEKNRQKLKPSQKFITRGPRKGQLVPKTYQELKAERRAASIQNYLDSKDS